MKVLMVGHDFDFSAGGGISRYANGLYEKLKDMIDVRTVSTGKIPRPVRIFIPIPAYGYDVVHAIYPDVAAVIKGNAKMVTMWHDLKMLTKFAESAQAKHEPKFVERYNIASGMIRSLVIANYKKSDAVIAHTAMVISDVKAYAKDEGIYDESKLYRIIPPGINEKFLDAKVWHGERRDFVYIGDIHTKHKNLDGLMDAFNSIASEENGARLHIFTKSPGAEALISERMPRFSSLSNGNVLLHYHAEDEKIIRVLSRAVACLHLSMEEGFGVPILESMAVGTPTIVLKSARIPDEVTRHAIKATVREVSSMAIKLMRKPMPAADAAIKYAKSFTWEDAARKTLALYREISKKS